MTKLDHPDGNPLPNNGDSGARLVLEDRFHRWNLSGMRIEMHEDAVSRIAYDLGRETTPEDCPAGLLLGKIRRLDPGTVTLKVMSVEPCDSTELHSTLMNCGFVLGFYRIVPQQELAFSEFDLNLAKSRFPSRDSVFLLLNPSRSGGARAGLFFWNDKGIGSEFSDFPVVERVAGEIPYVWPERIPDLPRPIAEIEPLPPADDVADWKQQAKARILALTSATAGGVGRLRAISSTWREYIPELPRLAAPDPENPEPSGAAVGWRRLAKPPVLASTLAIAATLIATAVIWPGRTPDRLHLGATVVKGGLRLNWSKGAPVASANEGVLIIRDGQQQQELPLSKKQLLEDSIVYMPASENVSFTLQVVAGGVVHRDSISVYTPRQNAQEAVASAGPQTIVPALPPSPVGSLTTLGSSRPETIVRALPQPEVKSPAPPEPVATKPPEPRQPASPATSTQPPAAEPAPVQVALATQPPLSNPSPVKEQPAREPQVVVPKQDRPQDSAAQVGPPQSRPIPIVEPAVPVPRPLPPAAAAPPVERPIPPQPLRQVKPAVPSSLKRLITREISMDVNLSIDADGRITRAEASTGPGLLQTSLGKLAVEAARLWKFQPARLGNRNVPGEVRIQFQFSP